MATIKYLAINTDKTKIMIFHPKSKNVSSEVNFVFNNNDIDVDIDVNIDVVQNKRFIYPIERITNESRPNPAFKILGVWLNENLTFDFHISVNLKRFLKPFSLLKKYVTFCL